MSKAAVDGKFKCEGRCRLCRRSSAIRPLTRHRIYPGSMGGGYVPKNCIPLCRLCHDLVDNKWDSFERKVARRMLRSVMWPQEVAYAHRRFGDAFDTYYPRPARELVILARTDPALRLDKLVRRLAA